LVIYKDYTEMHDQQNIKFYSNGTSAWLTNIESSFTEEKRKCPTVGHVSGNMKKALRR